MNKSHNPTPEPTQSLNGHYAGFASRIIAFIIDIAVISGILVFLSWFANTTMDMLQMRPLLVQISSMIPILEPVITFTLSPLGISIISSVIIVSYFLFFWTIAGQTIGKGVMGIRIVPLKGGKLSLLRALVRYFSYFVSAFTLGIGFLWILVDDRRLGLHDKIARTCVIYAWDARPDERFLYIALRKIESQRKALKSLVRRGHKIGELTTDNQAALPEHIDDNLSKSAD